jgi:hypothetical protein
LIFLIFSDGTLPATGTVRRPTSAPTSVFVRKNFGSTSAATSTPTSTPASTSTAIWKFGKNSRPTSAPIPIYVGKSSPNLHLSSIITFKVRKKHLSLTQKSKCVFVIWSFVIMF